MIPGVIEKEENISEFGVKKTRKEEAFDFSRAKRINAGGSVCNAYIGRHFRRRVFVKRLKEEFRNSSLHLAALDKEFDVGVTLSHPSLPHYLEIHDDFIIMDFIDGEPLSDLIRKDDPWLHNLKNIQKLISELLEVLEYLHIHHVVHSDLKADNVLLAGPERKAVLIDFDKCHTDWLDDTYASPEKLGLPHDSKVGPEWDFLALGSLVESLAEKVPKPYKRKLKRFVDKTKKKETGIAELKEYINNINSRKVVFIPAFIVLFILSAVILIFIISGSNNKKSQKTAALYDQTNEIKSESNREIPESDIVSNELKLPAQQIIVSEPKENIKEENNQKNSLEEDIEKEFPKLYAPHKQFMEKNYYKISNKNLTSMELFDIYDLVCKDLLNFLNKINNFFKEAHPELSEGEVLNILYGSRQFENFQNQFKEFTELKDKKLSIIHQSDSLSIN